LEPQRRSRQPKPRPLPELHDKPLKLLIGNQDKDNYFALLDASS
jgi:hypothetical protein